MHDNGGVVMIILFFREKGAQSGIELVVIIGILALAVLGVFGILAYKFGIAERENMFLLLEGVSNIVSSEVNLATQVDGDYYREFTLPDTIGKQDYEILRPNSKEMVFRNEKGEYVLFFESDIHGEIHKGSNIIKKTNGSISFNS
ncbi:hypothetical protein JW711_02970 [Candidatus Woesearchaeota archaeon]|nr:hypothetical protein [Candidatus Woesearchaeota archaeon]